MSESVIADFVGTFNAEITPRGEPVKGRIVCSEKRLVLAADSDNSLHIPLSSIYDVGVGHVPPELGDFFDSTVTVVFRRDDRAYVAVVEADDETIRKFSTVLFKALVNGTAATLKHPARRGGRVTDESFETATLTLQPRAVQFESDRRSITIDLTRVTSFDRNTRVIGEEERNVLVVSHMHHGEAMTTLVAARPARKLSILGRYLRREYAELRRDLEDVELTDDKVDLLVALYSGAGGPDISLASVLDVDPAQVTMLLNELEEDGLVESTDDGTDLTPMGQVVVANNVEE